MTYLNNDVHWCLVPLFCFPPERHYVSVEHPHTLTLTNATENVTIDCQGYGKPSPAVVWKKNGATIKKVPEFTERYSDQVVQVDDFAEPSQWNVTNRLYLRPAGVTYDEGGNYTCEVLNRTAGANYSEEQTIEVLCRFALGFLGSLPAALSSLQSWTKVVGTMVTGYEFTSYCFTPSWINIEAGYDAPRPLNQCWCAGLYPLRTVYTTDISTLIRGGGKIGIVPTLLAMIVDDCNLSVLLLHFFRSLVLLSIFFQICEKLRYPRHFLIHLYTEVTSWLSFFLFSGSYSSVHWETFRPRCCWGTEHHVPLRR